MKVLVTGASGGVGLAASFALYAESPTAAVLRGELDALAHQPLEQILDALPGTDEALDVAGVVSSPG